MKKISVVIVVVLIVVIGVLTYLFLNRKSYNLKLPNQEQIVSIKLEEGIGIKHISSKNTIADIYEIILKHNQNSFKKSTTDTPIKPNTLIKISFYYDNELATYIYFYTKNSKYYMEQPFNGIYEINQDSFEKMEHLLDE